MEQKTRLSGRVAARITSRGPALEMQEHGKCARFGDLDLSLLAPGKHLRTVKPQQRGRENHKADLENASRCNRA